MKYQSEVMHHAWSLKNRVFPKSNTSQTIVTCLEEEAKKPVAERRLPEFGSDKDFQLAQALNKLKGLPVKASTTLAERKTDKKDD